MKSLSKAEYSAIQTFLSQSVDLDDSGCTDGAAVVVVDPEADCRDTVLIAQCGAGADHVHWAGRAVQH